MRILLGSNRTVGEVREEFSSSFPYLKIVFLCRKEDPASGTVTEEVDPAARLIEVSGVLKEGDIDIRSTETVKEVEQRFEKVYGLPVHILRKQKGVWMDTTVTDDLTLHEQNTWGCGASKPLKTKFDVPINWNNFSTGK